MDIVLGLALATAVALVPFLACILLEQVRPIERYSLRARIPGLLMSAAGTPLAICLAWPLKELWKASGVAPAATVPLWPWLEPLGGWGYAAQVAVLVVVADFLAYLRHRAEHVWLWRIHSVHHSPRELHAANNIGHPLQAFFSLAFIAVPMSLIQVDGPEVPFAVAAFVALLSIYIHSPVELHFGRLRKIVVDNRFHRIHHSMEPRHFGKNFGICLSVWDHLFGTAYDPGDEWPRVGLAHVPPPRTVGEYLAMPFRRFDRREDREEAIRVGRPAAHP